MAWQSGAVGAAAGHADYRRTLIFNAQSWTNWCGSERWVVSRVTAFGVVSALWSASGRPAWASLRLYAAPHAMGGADSATPLNYR